jgi:hypothetical protein
MASGHKTGGRKKGTPNKAKLAQEVALAEAAERATGSLPLEQIAAMTPLDVMAHAMKLEAMQGKWSVAATLAERVAPYFHSKLAPKPDHREGNEMTIVISGGLPVD